MSRKQFICMNCCNFDEKEDKCIRMYKATSMQVLLHCEFIVGWWSQVGYLCIVLAQLILTKMRRESCLFSRDILFGSFLLLLPLTFFFYYYRKSYISIKILKLNNFTLEMSNFTSALSPYWTTLLLPEKVFDSLLF